MLNDARYEPVERTLPTELPSITRVEAHKAAVRIFRHFGGVQHGSPNMAGPAEFRGKVRRCWISSKPTGGHRRGWGRLIHDVSHDIFSKRHPRLRPHAGGHSKLEREIAEFVVAQGWLTGSLRPVKRPKIAPTPEEKRAIRIARIEARLKRWYAKDRRVRKAIAKLERQYARLCRVVAVQQP